jgi:threonyl-tRNA synthetase
MILLEHYAGNLPVWLSPVQVKVLPITDKQRKAAEEIFAKIKKAGIRAELDDRSETLGAKIRDAQMMRIPYMVIVGQKEVAAGKIALRTREEKDLGQIALADFIKMVQEKITEKDGQL